MPRQTKRASKGPRKQKEGAMAVKAVQQTERSHRQPRNRRMINGKESCAPNQRFSAAPFAIQGAAARNNSMSTRGTRISSECAMPVQSESRRSWFRMYQQDSKQETVERGEWI